MLAINSSTPPRRYIITPPFTPSSAGMELTHPLARIHRRDVAMSVSRGMRGKGKGQ